MKPSLMRARIQCNGVTYETIDVPEAIGPWIARLFGALQPSTSLTEGGYFRAEIA